MSSPEAASSAGGGPVTHGFEGIAAVFAFPGAFGYLHSGRPGVSTTGYQ